MTMNREGHERAGRMPTRRAGVRWREDAIARAVIEWYRDNDCLPKPSDWIYASETHPTKQTVIRVFCDWDVALEYAVDSAHGSTLCDDIRAKRATTAGASEPMARMPTRRTGVRWTPDVIAYAIAIWCRRHGRIPKAGDWISASNSNPSPHTVIRVFGTWAAAVEHAATIPGRLGRGVRDELYLHS